MSDWSWLPDEPDIFGDIQEFSGAPCRHKWLPGAFGDRKNITDIGPHDGFRIVDADWKWENEETKDVMLCVIKKAELVAG